MAERDAEVLRRGLRAGVVVAGAVGLVLLVGVVLTGDPQLWVVALLASVAVAAFVTAAWLLLAALLDLLAGQPPGTRRMLWTMAALLVSLAWPYLVVAAFPTAG